jgi:hypothetical protein
MKETEFDKLVIYTLRIELLNGKVLLFPIDTENKQKLINRFRESAEGDITNDRLKFIWFETPSNRMVIVNTDSIVQVTFCFDYASGVINPYAYRDNFDVIVKDTRVEEKTTEEGEIQLHIEEEKYLPQAIIYHKGKAPDDSYNINPLQYSELSEGCLFSFDDELEGDLPLRQFLNLIDIDGEESFIALDQIIALELDKSLIFGEGEGDEEVDDDNDEIET